MLTSHRFLSRDFDDAYSWIPSTFSGQGDACLYWANLTTKPAYTTVQSLLAAAATAPVSSTSTASTITSFTTSATKTTSTATSVQAEWGQCGGSGWTGPTACASPYTCQYQNDWYSQCL